MGGLDAEEQAQHKAPKEAAHDSWAAMAPSAWRCMERYEGESDYSEGEESDCMSEYSDYAGYVEYTNKYEHLSKYELDQLTAVNDPKSCYANQC